MNHFNIPPLSKKILPLLQNKIDNKTKPIGSLGVLEKIAIQIGQIQESTTPIIKNPHMVVFAADHGLAEMPVSKYPQEVTSQMVVNFLNGGAAINVFCKQHQLKFYVVDAGVKNLTIKKHSSLISKRIANGTHNCYYKTAMNKSQLEQCFKNGIDIVNRLKRNSCSLIGFGEMGIGNTSSAALIMNLITKIDLHYCVGKGTGINEKQYQIKFDILQKIAEKYNRLNNVLDIMQAVGGFEIIQMCAAMLQAASYKMIILVDGFIATAALLLAYSLNSNVLDYCIYTHQSDEKGHKLLLKYLNAKPLLQLNMRLGEATGCAVAYPLIQSAVLFLNEMASFESAEVSKANI